PCYPLHRLAADEGELFAERFAQALLFPPAAAARAAAELGKVSGDEALRLLAWYAGKYEVPMSTILARVDLLLAHQGRKVSGLKRKQRGC
ncbi:hypothetical protein ACTUM2_14680, partial [Listeria monocytogenes]|uniref:hypothetical protein n=1 Tax=Listeria monocytogenes TaxID=1639 RepID=UPI003FA431DA